MTRSYQFAATGVILLLLLVGYVVLTHNVLTAPYPGHNDFMTPFEASRAFWLDGLNPYGSAATERIQLRIFGREPLPEEDPGFFSYPLYATYMIVPLLGLDYAWASAVWMVLLQVCLIAALLLAFDIFGYRPAVWLLPVWIIWMLGFYPSARGLILGQLSHVGVLLQVLAIWALLRRRDRLAGVALALSTFKPQMGYLLVPFLLLWAFQARRWQVIGWFAGVFAALMASAFVFYPAWFSEWLHRLSVYPTYTRGNAVQIVTGGWLGLGTWAEWLFSGALYAAVLVSWWVVLVRRRHPWWLWTVVWTLTLTHIVAPRTATPHFTLFALMMIGLAAELTRRASHWRANGGVLLLLALTLVLPWLHFLATVGGVAGEQEGDSVFVIMPLVTLLALLLSRPLWADAARPAAQAKSVEVEAEAAPTTRVEAS
ncbi:MAG: glycosyltransferase family 87 protein [Chloroflexota bacterium]